MALPKRGIDISEFNGSVDIVALQGQVDFVIIRCGYGSDYANQDDPQFEANVKKCQAAGIPWGTYLYSYAKTKAMAQSEAAHTLRLLQGRRPPYGVWYDVEDSSHGMITFENGSSIIYQAAWSINAQDEEGRMDLYGAKGGLCNKKHLLIREEASGMTETTLSYTWKDCYTRQLEAFGRVVRGEEESRTPVEDGLAIQRILNGLYLSAQTGKEIEL